MLKHGWASLAIALALSCVLLIPCFWLPLVSTGDLQSHLYNAWLASLIHRGEAPGLWIGRQTTNVLVDLPLAWLLDRWGPAVAERLVTSCAVLIFFWGSFAYLSAAYRRRADQMAPWLAILTYGYVFQTGLLNYYVSTGLVLWAMAILESRATVPRAAASGTLSLVAATAHPVPVVWFVARALYRQVAGRLSRQAQAALFFCAALTVLAGSRFLTAHYLHVWSAEQLTHVAGVDQVLLYGWRYTLVAALFVALLIMLLAKQDNRWRLATGSQAQVYALTALAIAMLPSFFRSSWQSPWVGFMAERLSLIAAILIFALLGDVGRPRWTFAMGTVTAALFFGLLWSDLAVAARIEAKIESLVSGLPPRQRVVFNLDASSLSGYRTDDRTGTPRGIFSRPLARVSLTHLLSRACINRCFDYMNYEPSTGQFRIRAMPGNSIVASDISVVYAMEAGTYRMRSSDPVVYAIHRCGPAPTELCIDQLAAGQSIRDLGFVASRPAR